MNLLRRRLAQRSERGVSTVELALYMPLLMVAILISVQFALIYLGNQAASAAAREAARVARLQEMSESDARQEAVQIIDNLGDGVLENPEIQVRKTSTTVHVEVSGEAVTLMEWLPAPRVSHAVEGPVERFIPDN